MSGARKPAAADPLVRALVAAVREVAQRREAGEAERRGKMVALDGGKAA